MAETQGYAAATGAVEGPRLQREAPGPRTSWDRIGRMSAVTWQGQMPVGRPVMRLGQVCLSTSSQLTGTQATGPGVPLAMGTGRLKPRVPKCHLEKSLVRRAGKESKRLNCPKEMKLSLKRRYQLPIWTKFKLQWAQWRIFSSNSMWW